MNEAMFLLKFHIFQNKHIFWSAYSTFEMHEQYKYKAVCEFGAVTYA